MEGQSGLRNPSGPCGSEFIVSGDADGVILQHPPKRLKFNGLDTYPADLPDILDEVDLIERLGAKVIGLTINTTGMNSEEIEEYRNHLASRTNIPVVFPFVDAMEPIVNAILALKK